MTRRFILVSLSTTLLVLLGLALNVGCQGGTGPFATPLYVANDQDPFTESGRFMTAITVFPVGVNLAVAGTQQFQAIVTFNDGTTEDWAAAVDWFAETVNVGAFEPSGGRFLAQRQGVTIIRARIRQGPDTLTSSAAYVNAFDPIAGIPPAAPVNPMLFASPEGVTVSWDLNATDNDLQGYNLWRTQTSSAHYSTDYGKINIVPIIFPPYTDGTVVSGWYYYRLTAVDLTGVNSYPSKEISVFITGENHYGSGYDGGVSSVEDSSYKAAFEVAF